MWPLDERRVGDGGQQRALKQGGTRLTFPPLGFPQ
jgi:hypothetical protein